jgi:hypothetical protein
MISTGILFPGMLIWYPAPRILPASKTNRSSHDWSKIATVQFDETIVGEEEGTKGGLVVGY